MTKKHGKDNRDNRIIKLEEKISELENGWKRTAADFDNYRKRNEEIQSQLLEFSKADFITKITPVLDNFRRAFVHAPNDGFACGIKQIEKQLEDILVSEGLERIDVKVGDKFDHNLHEAISFEKNNKISTDHIIAEVESGWKYKDKVLKPSKVRVSKGK